jgi:acetyl-CoA C-acetyltransferase
LRRLIYGINAGVSATKNEMLIDARTPILIGAGQAVSHWHGSDAAGAPSPLSLASEAGQRALADTGQPDAVAKAIDVVAVVRAIVDSTVRVKAPFPQCANPPRALVQSLGLEVARAVYSVVGGDQPQALVNEFAEVIFRGEAKAVLLAGAEGGAAMKTAARNRIALNWSQPVDGEMEDRGLGRRLLSEYEISNGLGAPTQTYPIIEHALRARLGVSREAYRAMISELWANFSAVAERHPYAQFPVARTADFLSTPSVENYEIADPYLKWHVAQDAVNQGAALVMTSAEQARSLGVAEDKWIYLHGYAQAADRFVTERRDLSRSRAMELVLKRALDSAGKSAFEISCFDLYSCFPCAVLIAAEILGLDWRATALTVTGGLPFFGGAGNNYSMHAIATMVERLRQEPGSFGLVLANGGFLSKEAAGVYSTTPKENWRPVPLGDLQASIHEEAAPILLQEDAEAMIESYTVTYKRGAPRRGYVLAQSDKGRILARAFTGHRSTLAALARVDPIGRSVNIHHDAGVNFICAAGRIGASATGAFLERGFEFVAVARQGRILEVTLNRPAQMNALHSAAHFELHEIWDAFEQDRDLWVAILTGAGDRSFCSGNDLKATAQGADVSTPVSGFGGMCSRFGREKPIIAAVNGVAMGGGLEIVLACDLAVADETARLALPEVKVGLFAAAGGVQRLTRQIGRKAAMELILTGKTVTAQRALELGIVNAVTAKGESLPAARSLAATIVANSPSAVRASKQVLNKLEEIEDLKAALDASPAILGRVMRTKDFKEGVTAFVEKRTPQWSNG